MIKLHEAYEIVISTKIKLGTENIELQNSLGRVLAEDVFSDLNMPPFDKSAMDGFACRYQDLYNELEQIEVIPAGKMPEKTIGKNQCSKIMTGAPIPKGADTVFIVEDSKEISPNKIIYTKPKPEIDICSTESGNAGKSNICLIGEDIQQGAKVLDKGILIKPQHVAVLASVGCVKPLVSKRPRIAVIATGSELVEPEIKPTLSQIRNSNGSQMMAQLNNLNVDANYYGIAIDDEKATQDIFDKAMSENDIIMLSGGVSEGDFDFVPKILRNAGFEIKFDRVAVQPGKPTTFATAENKICFGMPGNPVSSFVQFELLLKPLLYKLMKHDVKLLNVILPMASDFTRKRAGRFSWIPVTISEKGEVEVIDYHGSAHINGLVFADGLIGIPIGIKSLKKGELINVRQI